MPAILERLKNQLMEQGKSKESAYAIATAALQKSWNLKKWTNEATMKWKLRWAMSASERAKDRASGRSGHAKSEYNYNAHTNRATLKKSFGGKE